MSDPLTPTILDTMAQHLRRCAVLIDDAPSVDVLMRCAHQFEDRAEEIRQDNRKEAAKHAPLDARG